MNVFNLFLAGFLACSIQTTDSPYNLPDDAINVIISGMSEIEIAPILADQQLGWLFYPAGTLAWKKGKYDLLLKEQTESTNYGVLKAMDHNCLIVAVTTKKPDHQFDAEHHALKSAFPSCSTAVIVDGSVFHFQGTAAISRHFI